MKGEIDMDYRKSNTTLSATWVQDSIWKSNWHCSNCSKIQDINQNNHLDCFCSRCGAKMENPQYISIEYDYD